MNPGDKVIYRYRALDGVAPGVAGADRPAVVLTVHEDQYGDGHHGHHVRVETEQGDITDHRDPHEFFRADAPAGHDPGCVRAPGSKPPAPTSAPAVAPKKRGRK